MEKFFKLKKHGTSVGTEVVAGLTTFFTMAYIIFVNPSILSATGMDWGGVFIATIIASVVGTLIMGLVANVPYAVAPGMGLNAFFTYTVCMGMGFVWQEALAMVFICGLLNIIITVTKVRKIIIKAIPVSLQSAIGGAIGLFIAYIGLKNAGFLSFGATSEGVTAGADVVPGLATFNDPGAIVALIGLFIIVTLMILKVKGSIFIGIVVSSIVALIAGVTTWEAGTPIFDIGAAGAVGNVAFAFFGAPGFGSMFADPTKILTILITIFAFSLSDTFDTIGTFIGTGRKSGIFDKKDEDALEGNSGFKSKMDKALFADATATSIGALVGTSNTTTYIESASGISAGGRTGLTSVVVAVMFILCIPFANVFGMVPGVATAPALIVVGVLMAEAFASIKWANLEESLPAFMTVIIMAFAYNISYGIAAGFIFYCLIKICKGAAKEVHPIIYGATALFILNFIVMALGII